MQQNQANKDRSSGAAGSRRWRRYRIALRLYRGPIEIAPFLNLGLLMLIALLFSSDFVLQPGVRVELPMSRFTVGTPYGPMIVTMTQEGMVFFNDERLPLERLGEAFAGLKHRHKDAAITVQADYRVPYGAVVRVMNMALDAGIRTVNLASQPSFDQETVPWDE